MISMQDAVIYDLDEKPMVTKKWTELRNIQIYREFFKEHDAEFDK
jgi:predicted ATPase